MVCSFYMSQSVVPCSHQGLHLVWTYRIWYGHTALVWTYRFGMDIPHLVWTYRIWYGHTITVSRIHLAKPFTKRQNFRQLDDKLNVIQMPIFVLDKI